VSVTAVQRRPNSPSPKVFFQIAHLLADRTLSDGQHLAGLGKAFLVRYRFKKPKWMKRHKRLVGQ